MENKVKGSRFIGSASPIHSEEQAAEFIDTIKKEFHDASHNCSAWKIGIGKRQKYRYNDNGEPSGTAGQPILRAIDSMNIANICVVVSRFFGGAKLGTGGLARAYGQTTLALLRAGEPERKFLSDSVEFSVDFDFVNVVHYIVEKFSAELEDSAYAEKVTFRVKIRSSRFPQFKEKLIEATNGQIAFK